MHLQVLRLHVSLLRSTSSWGSFSSSPPSSPGSLHHQGPIAAAFIAAFVGLLQVAGYALPHL